MGIQGLLPQLKSIMAPISVEELKGQKVAVDTYSWLHKGALFCGDRLCKGIPTSRPIDYCMDRVNLLRHHGIKPILVFDGGFLPMKSDQETKRARARKENLERAREHEAAGNSRAAFQCYQKAVDITPSIASELIQVLKQENVDYIVAPYEADAQMTFLSINRLVDAVITEDSDLIPFGCSRIIFKMDKYGQGLEFQSAKLQKNRELDFNGFTKQMLLEMCILSGCDYLPSLPGMGVKRAHALIQKLKCHEKVVKHLRYSSVSVPPEYEENFKKAVWAFQYQRVYDPASEEIVHLSGIPDGLDEDLEFLGPWLPQTVVKGIAEGNLDPLTKEPFEGKTDGRTLLVDKVFPFRESIPANGKRRLDLPVQKNLLTNYFCLASLEAKRKFRAPKVTPKQQTSTEVSLCSPQYEDTSSGSPGLIEDASSPADKGQASQLSSERLSCEIPLEDPINVASQCSSDHVGSEPPLEDSDIVDAKIEDKFCNGSRAPTVSCLGQLQGTKPFLASYKEQSSIPVIDSRESKMASTKRNVTVRSSFFNRRLPSSEDCGNQGLDILHDKENNYIGCSFSRDSLRNNGGILKRRRHADLHNFDSETLQPTDSQGSPSAADEAGSSDTDPLDDGASTNAEGGFGSNISHVNKYAGIAEKSMEEFVALISSFRYTKSGSRASGLRAPMKDVKNTLSVRSKDLSKSKHTAKKLAVRPPDLSKFAYKATDTAVRPPDLSTFAHTPAKRAVSRPDQIKFACTATEAAADPPDLSTFMYKPAKAALSRPDVSRSTYTPVDVAVRPDQSKFACTATEAAAEPPDLSTFMYKPANAALSRPDVTRSAYTPVDAAISPDWSKFARKATKMTVDPPDLSTFAYTPLSKTL